MTSTPSRHGGAGLAPGPSKWRAFGAIAPSYIVIVFSTAMAFLLLPDIADEFDVTLRAVGWVVIVESLIVAALLLPMGSLADAVGRRRVLLGGMAVFSIGTLFTGLAPSFALLIVARIIMAIGNALVQSIGTGLLVASFPPEERGLALAAQTTAVAVGGSSGPLVAGFALEVMSWKTIFVLVAIASFAATVGIAALIDVDEGSTKAPQFDRKGAALSALAITVLVVVITNPFDVAWISPLPLAGAALGGVLLWAFVRTELATEAPMLELGLFRLAPFRIAVTIRVLGFVSSTSTNLLLPVYLLSLRGTSAREAGVLLFLMALGMGLSAQVSGRFYDRFGARAPSFVGLSLMIAVNLAMAPAGETTPIAWIAVLVFLLGISMGLWNVANNSVMLDAPPPESLGVVGAFTNVTRTVGNVLGQAVAAAVVVGVMASQGFDVPLDEIDETAGAGAAFLDGWTAAFLIAAGLTAFTLVISTRLPSRRVPAAP